MELTCLFISSASSDSVSFSFTSFHMQFIIFIALSSSVIQSLFHSGQVTRSTTNQIPTVDCLRLLPDWLHVFFVFGFAFCLAHWVFVTSFNACADSFWPRNVVKRGICYQNVCPFIYHTQNQDTEINFTPYDRDMFLISRGQISQSWTSASKSGSRLYRQRKLHQ